MYEIVSSRAEQAVGGTLSVSVQDKATGDRVVSETKDVMEPL